MVLLDIPDDSGFREKSYSKRKRLTLRGDKEHNP